MDGWQEETRKKGLQGPGCAEKVLQSNRGHGGPWRICPDSLSRVLSTTLPGVAQSLQVTNSGQKAFVHHCHENARAGNKSWTLATTRNGASLYSEDLRFLVKKKCLYL